MALTTDQKASFLFKQALGVAETSVFRDFFEEAIKGRILVLNNQLWAQSDSIPTTAPVLADGATSGVVQYFEARAMTAVAGVTNSFYLSDLVDSIPFNFGDGSYNYVVTSSTGTAIPFGQGDWLVNNTAGTLTFYGSVPANMPPKISFYKYIGTKGGSTGGSGVTSVNGDTGPAVVLTAASVGAVATTGGTMTGALTMNAQNEIRFADADSSNYVGFRADTTVAANITWTLPSADGTNGYVLTTDGLGKLSWTAPGVATTGTLVHPTTGSTFEYGIANPSMTGTTNTVIGVYSGTNITTGTGNTVFGSGLSNLTTGNYNTAVGGNVLLANDAGSNNIAVGFSVFNSLSNTAISDNIGIGKDVATSVASASQNVAIGTSALQGITNAIRNVAIGYEAGKFLDAANYNTIINSVGPSGAFSGTVSIGTDSDGFGSAPQNNDEFVLGTDKHSYVLYGKVKENITIAGSATLKPSVKLKDFTSTKTITITSPNILSNDITFTLPETAGLNGQVLTTDGSGTLSWASAGSGVTSVNGDTGPTVVLTAASVGAVATTGGTMTGALTMNTQNEIRFADADSSNYVGFRADTTVAANITWTLPSADGTSGQLLSTNGSGTLSWSTPSSGSTTVSTKTNSYTLQESDSGTIINMTNPGSASVTVPPGLTANFNCKIIRTGGPVKLTSIGLLNSITSGTMVSAANGVLNLQGYSSNTYNLSGDLNQPLYGCVIDGTVFAQVIVGNSAFIGGSFTTITDTSGNVYSRNRIAKINIIDGTVDTTFDPGTGFNGTVYALDYVARSVTAGISDSLYVGGSFTSYNAGSSTNINITKLNGTNGLADSSFSANANSTVFSLKAETSAVNALFAAGAFTTYNSTGRQYIVKANLATGAIDTTFDTLSGFNAQVNAIAIDSSGNIYAGGNFTTYKATNRQYIAKLNPTNATLDATFDAATGFNNFVRAVHITFSSDVYVGGDFVSYKGTTRQYIAKLNPTTAALDTTFDSASGFNNAVRCITSQQVGALVILYIGGSFTTYKATTRQYVAKISGLSGALDTTFDTSNACNNIVHAINLSSSNSIVNIAGAFTSYKGNTKIKYACKLDSTYGQISNDYIVMGLRFNGAVNAIAISSDFAYVGGSFTSVTDANGNVFTRLYIAKINYVTGEVDSTFDSATGFSDIVRSIVLSGSDLYVGGSFFSYKGTTRAYIAKINASTAALDTTFNTTTGFSAAVYSMVLSGSDLYVGGAFSTYKGTNRERIAKINASTAALDTTFDSITGFNAIVRSIALLGSDLYAGGSFTTYKGTARQYIAKINASTAALDTTFDAATGFSGGVTAVNSIAVSASGLYAGGEFSTYKGTARQCIAKINISTAALDTTFDAASGFSSTVNTIALSATDVYVGGAFLSYKGVARDRIAKINASTAALDTTFNPSVGFGGDVNTVVLSGSSLYTGGSFTSYSSTTIVNYWAVLNATNSKLTSYTIV